MKKQLWEEISFEESYEEATGESFKTIEADALSLLDLFEFYLVERDLGKPVLLLQEVVSDLRIVINRILLRCFFRLPQSLEVNFCTQLAILLTERAELRPSYSPETTKYVDYVISEILLPFEYAQEIKAEHPDNVKLQRLYAEDIPILRPFHYGEDNEIESMN
ncbi:MAG: hypothetical protein COX62_04885 [Deltaproteobacteria bacterium CG_4_10_14_0_2_um_filter_43_8]|nr:MAG: hypothetical protein COV43_08000 [Deltaproteobacteria bacterium CG11_big_fil_rev_8_21_14_0_20_42_23]PJA20368.1 MAG: hypothetical protein COX62_04885 [Deltaproteobacteria bacterium CG_4_10_14_0_2_um_filter_43_8]PJC64154.1 MAG: hypothetical protein CO021_05775 [Deltaproteobacteria bacterium CG_4_9_14_0_2_um_filter_42_21]